MEANDYYPFGQVMPSRTYALSSAKKGRWGYNGQEKDNELKGDGVSLDYKYRNYDSRLCRFSSVDPIAAKFPHNSPYAFAENRVIDGRELEGLEVLLIGKQEAAGIAVGGNVEVGVLLVFKDEDIEVYAYGSFSAGGVSNASLSSSISVTYFPTMPEANDAAGWGSYYGVSWDWGLSVGINAVNSGDYWGINVTAGPGIGLSPVQGQIGVSNTSIKPISNSARKQAMGILSEARNNILVSVKEMQSKQTELNSRNSQLSKENANLKKQLSVATNDAEKSSLQEKINANNSEYWGNYDKMQDLNKDIGELNDALQKVDAGIEKLKSDSNSSH